MRGVVVAAFLFIAGSAEAQVANGGSVCQAERDGDQLITRMHYPDGYSIEGPWHVEELAKPGSRSMAAVLDHFVETRPLSGKRLMIELPAAIRTTFSGRTMDELLNEAASVWCETILTARPHAPPVDDYVWDDPKPIRMM